MLPIQISLGQKYTRHATLSIEAGIELLKRHCKNNTKKTIKIGDFDVNIKTKRLRTFVYRGTSCVCCGAQGLFFSFDTCQDKERPHINLWAVNEKGEEVLMTQDHTLARGLGGEDVLENTEPMCAPCNNFKSKLEHKLANQVIPPEQLERIESGKFKADDIKGDVLSDAQIRSIPLELIYSWVRNGAWKQKDFLKWVEATKKAVD